MSAWQRCWTKTRFSLFASGKPVLDDPGGSDADFYLLCIGATGLPKGVMWPYKALLMAALGRRHLR